MKCEWRGTLLTVIPGTRPTAHDHPSQDADSGYGIPSCTEGTERTFPDLLGLFLPPVQGQQGRPTCFREEPADRPVCLSLSVSVSLSLCLSPCLSLSVSVPTSLSLSPSLSVSPPLCLSLSVSLSLPVSVSLSPSVSLLAALLTTPTRRHGQRVGDKQMRGRDVPSVRLTFFPSLGMLNYWFLAKESFSQVTNLLVKFLSCLPKQEKDLIFITLLSRENFPTPF